MCKQTLILFIENISESKAVHEKRLSRVLEQSWATIKFINEPHPPVLPRSPTPGTSISHLLTFSYLVIFIHSPFIFFIVFEITSDFILMTSSADYVADTLRRTFWLHPITTIISKLLICCSRFLRACVAWRFLSSLRAQRKQGSRDKESQSREEPGREKNRFSQLRRLVRSRSNCLNRQATRVGFWELFTTTRCR